MRRTDPIPARLRRVRALAMMGALALAVVAEPLLAASHYSRAGSCPCGHHEAEPSTPSCATGLCHERPQTAEAASEQEPSRARSAAGESCIDDFCPHCSSDEPRTLAGWEALRVPPPRSEGLARSGAIDLEPPCALLPGVPFEILHIPIV